MTISMTDTEARLEGDWTLSGVTSNLAELSLSLQQFEPGSDHNLRIDCGEIQKTDESGMQLLSVWLQCFRFRGVEPTLVNVPERLRQTMQHLDFKQYLSDKFPGQVMAAA